MLFVVGSDDNQVMFYPDFDHIVLLSAPRDVMIERLASIRRSATHEIDTSKPIDRVIDEIHGLVQQPPAS